MNELDPMILLAVFHEMLGPLLWLLVGVATLGLIAFVALLVRDRRVIARRLVCSQALGALGGALALVIMARVSSSGFTDAGGPADWILIALVFGAGMVGTAILVYTIVGWYQACRGRQCRVGRPTQAQASR